MPDVSMLDVRLYGEKIATLTLIPGDRTLFAFDKAYVDKPERSTLSLSFKDQFGQLLTEFRPVNVRVPPFFANLLPEGPLRTYLAERAGVSEKREFFLLWVLGRDLPGALTILPADAEAWPDLSEEGDAESRRARRTNALRFSLAGVQLKFSAVKNVGKGGGLTIPADGVGGSWIVKLPSQLYDGVPENEFSMMSLAARLGMDVPEVRLLDIDAIDGLPEGMRRMKGQALAIRRFDRSGHGPVHIEDFAQVFGVWPDDKYKRASARNIATVLGIEAGDDGVSEFIRRLVFNTLIGNADMHLKNWSVIYPDRRTAALAPAYDFVSTIAYISDEFAAIKYARTKRMREFSLDELRYLAAKAHLPQKLVVDTALETVTRFRDEWPEAKKTLPIARNVAEAIDAHLQKLALISEA
ncbi:type II toxin-antitoxin system HipA family toxin [Mesorhizobium sp. WSM4307]|uniref:type II toxin-antitoxin system HipA family toxin n=1 Tax=unclassified Mesorhizobium TaxID=325217 RepID=UPI000BAFDF10|nr:MULTISPECIES: HipA domain-containing protein [unclassified Mesorhizobium]PBB24382.1 kinase [Mesorhizobium sp. WSM4304]PBB74650.1 kinase [Mesorhizobium sp. WSM4308]TRC71656.1 type II toxin-antitoxin system HipA family toxin [Mesorhizobium sp. WSM4315]TRC83460.1 type II toxin-antitoxin system HipA family toxin [Mesorhizobium sp. WSM4307]